jgi:hypothetical protein
MDAISGTERSTCSEASAAAQSTGGQSRCPGGLAASGGIGVRNSASRALSLPRRVRAPYSSLGEASHTGTMLCAST